MALITGKPGPKAAKGVGGLLRLWSGLARNRTPVGANRIGETMTMERRYK